MGLINRSQCLAAASWKYNLSTTYLRGLLCPGQLPQIKDKGEIKEGAINKQSDNMTGNLSHFSDSPLTL